MARGTLTPLVPPLVVAFLLAAVGVSCRRLPAEPLVVGSVRLPGTALLYIAEDVGCFGGRGPAIILRDYLTGRDALAALRRGVVSVAAAYQTPVVANALEDPSLRILTTLHTASQSSSHLATRSDRGIRAAADLDGKRIGVPRRTSAESFVRTLLVFEGIDPAHVTFVDMAPDEAADALLSDRVDAVAVWSPYVDRAAAAVPAPVRVELVSDVYTEMSMLVTREAVRAARATALLKLVRCVGEAQRALDASPDRGYSLAQRLFPDQEAASLAQQWSETAHHVGLQNALRAILREEAEWLGPPAPGAHPPRFVAMFAPEFLEDAVPESVTFVGR